MKLYLFKELPEEQNKEFKKNNQLVDFNVSPLMYGSVFSI